MSNKNNSKTKSESLDSNSSMSLPLPTPIPTTTASLKPLSLTNHTIVLDVDETLVHSDEDMKMYQELNPISNPELKDLDSSRFYLISLVDPESGLKSELWGITRPHLSLFLIFCFNYFKHVCIWSAGQTKYVEAVSRYIFGSLRSPDLIYTNPKCVQNDDILQKPLLRMIDENPNLELSLEHTFILDDRKSVYSNCNPSNGIQIPAYTPLPIPSNLKADENSYSYLMKWFMQPEVILSDDVRMLDKSCIFLTPEPMAYLPIKSTRSKLSSPRAGDRPRRDSVESEEKGGRPRSPRSTSRSPRAKSGKSSSRSGQQSPRGEHGSSPRSKTSSKLRSTTSGITAGSWSGSCSTSDSTSPRPSLYTARALRRSGGGIKGQSGVRGSCCGVQRGPSGRDRGGSGSYSASLRNKLESKSNVSPVAFVRTFKTAE